MFWVNPSWQPSPTLLLTGGIGRVKVRKFVG